MAKCWWLLKIEPSLSPPPLKNGPKPLAKLYNSITHQRTRELLQLEGQRRLHSCLCRPAFGSIFSNHQHFAVSTGTCGVACPLPASRVALGFIHLKCKPVLSLRKRKLHCAILHTLALNCSAQYMQQTFFFENSVIKCYQLTWHNSTV